jgi:sec-independent protein translocase protein TatB
MFDVGFSEMLVIGVVALVVIGPEKLPRVARTVGHLMGRAQRYVNQVKRDIDREVQFEDLRKLQSEVQTTAADLQRTVETATQELQTTVDRVSLDLKSAENALKPTENTTPETSETSETSVLPEALEQLVLQEPRVEQPTGHPPTVEQSTMPQASQTNHLPPSSHT